MKKEKIIELLHQNKSIRFIAKTLNCSNSTVSYYRQQLGLSYKLVFKKINEIDWNLVNIEYNGSNKKEIQAKLNISNNLWRKAFNKGFIKSRKLTDEHIFTKNAKFNYRRQIRKWLLCVGENKCSVCGISNIWNNKPLVLQVDHINGINNDNRKENLRLICPNCHSQQDTYAGKNVTNINRRSKDYYKKCASVA